MNFTVKKSKILFRVKLQNQKLSNFGSDGKKNKNLNINLTIMLKNEFIN